MTPELEVDAIPRTSHSPRRRTVVVWLRILVSVALLALLISRMDLGAIVILNRQRHASTVFGSVLQFSWQSGVLFSRPGVGNEYLRSSTNTCHFEFLFVTTLRGSLLGIFCPQQLGETYFESRDSQPISEMGQPHSDLLF